MSMHAHHPLWKLASAGLFAALALQGCGGGTSASSNTSATQLASGVITGFGSVFVDGTEIEDAKASVQKENADGTHSNTVLQMGQRIRVKHDGKGTASQVTVDASVIGLVSNVTTNTLTVAGQKISIQTDAATGPVTLWGGGYNSLADVKASDLAEVHGSPVYDSASKSYAITASRIQKLSTTAGRMQVTGTISNLDTVAKTYTLNSLTVNYSSAVLRPSNATLSNGTLVTAYAPLTAGKTMSASHIKVNHAQDSSEQLSNAQVGGQVSRYDSSTNTFEVQGIKIALSTSSVIDPIGRSVKDGAYVNVRGTLGSDGTLTATQVQVRTENTNTALASVKLIGVISDFVDANSFVVRGVPVDASTATRDSSCSNITLANDVGVQITATQQTDTPVVKASSIRCTRTTDTVIRPADGTVSSVDANTKTFVLASTRNTTTSTTSVQWNDTTTFVGVTASTLNTQKVRVEGYLSGTTLIARSVRAANTRHGLDDDAFTQSDDSQASDGWTNYKKRKH